MLSRLELLSIIAALMAGDHAYTILKNNAAIQLVENADAIIKAAANKIESEPELDLPL